MNCLSVCQKQIATNPRCSISGKLPQAGSSGGESKIKYAAQKNEKNLTMMIDPAAKSEPTENDPVGLTGGRESLAQSNCNLDESSVFDFETNAKINTSAHKNRAMKPIQA